LEEHEPEPEIVHRDQVKFKPVKPKPKETYEHFTIEEDRARMAQPKQGPEIEQEQFVSIIFYNLKIVYIYLKEEVPK
jgi:hypothetical protein